jgi:kynurenine formamidase
VSKLVDLTHPITDGMAVYPGDPVPVIEPHDTILSAGYNTTRLSLSNHTGTHLDVPYHFLAEGARVDEVELERFYGDATLIDLGPDRAIDVAALEPHAEAFQPGARVVYRTGWGSRFG